MSLIKERRLQIDTIGSSLTTDNDDEGRKRVESDNSFLSISNTESSNGEGADRQRRRPLSSRYRMRTIDDLARLVFDDLCDQVIRSEYESPSIPDVILEVIDEL